MRSLYLRIYLTVVAALALFALVSGWLVQRHLDPEREARRGHRARERVEAWADLLQRSLPGAEAPVAGAGGGAARLVAAPAPADGAGRQRRGAAWPPPTPSQRRESDGGPAG